MLTKLLIVLVSVSIGFALPQKGLPLIPDGHIVGGSDANLGQFPHMVSLYSSLAGRRFHYCGGSVISANWVLTAAHCVTGSDTVNVLMGARNISASVSEETSQQERTATGASMIIIHEAYTGTLTGNDIALIALSPPADLDTGFVSAVGLPLPEDDPVGGSVVWPSGWGYVSDDAKDDGVLPDILQYVDVQIISNEDCSSSWPVMDSMICTTAGAKNICNGDSGGPINQFEDMSRGGLNYGLTSYGRASCEVDVPSVFTRVSSFLDWIETNTGGTVTAHARH